MKGIVKLGGIVRRHPLLVSLVVGSLIITAWTLLRFFTDKSIFDLVGQQVFARAILEDGAADAILGATHYLVKVFLIYIPFDLLHLNPRSSLIAMTLLVNVATYVGIVFALREILKELNVKVSRAFYIAVLWFATTAGSIFWIEFTNSRNLEVVAGLWVIVLGLRFLRLPTMKAAVIFFLVSALTFFMDPLQVVMTAAPLGAYGILVAARDLSKRRLLLVAFVGILGAAFILSSLMTVLAEAALSVSLIDSSSSVGGIEVVFGQFIDATKGMVVMNGRFFGGFLEDGGRLRQLVALVGIAIALIAWLWLAVKKQLNLRLVTFVIVFGVVIEAAYFLSGQSLNGDTSRYLIMLAPIMAIVIASLLSAHRLSKVALVGVGVVIIVNTIFLGSMLIGSWNQRFSQDANLAGAANYAKSHPGTVVYASMDTALTTMYFNRDVVVLPLSCGAGKLQPARTFYPSSSYAKHQVATTGGVAILLDPGGYITNYPSVCSEQDVRVQFGQPFAEETTASGQRVLLYESDPVK